MSGKSPKDQPRTTDHASRILPTLMLSGTTAAALNRCQTTPSMTTASPGCALPLGTTSGPVSQEDLERRVLPFLGCAVDKCSLPRKRNEFTEQSWLRKHYCRNTHKRLESMKEEMQNHCPACTLKKHLSLSFLCLSGASNATAAY
eukprot:6012983-Amphidinium_carterae.2